MIVTKSVTTPYSCLAGVERRLGRERTAGRDALSRHERRRDLAARLHGADDQLAVARVGEREGALLLGRVVFYRAKFNNIFGYLHFRRPSGVGRGLVDADTVGYDQRSVAAAVGRTSSASRSEP